MPVGDSTVISGPLTHRSESFQNLLLQFSVAASVDHDENALIQIFCSEARRFFEVSGVYFWRYASEGELVGGQSDGVLAAQFPGSKLRANESAVAVEALRSRRTLYMNNLEPGRYPVADTYRARAILAAPLVIAGDV